MRVAVTGGAGFIGSHLLERLCSRGHEVLCLDSLDRFYPAPVKLANLAEVSASPSLTFACLDLVDAPAVQEVFEAFHPEAVVHLAATAGVRPSIDRPLLYVSANVTATQSVLSACATVGCNRIVLAGSSSVYGRSSPAPFREEDASDEPQSPYAATKRAMELLGAAHASVHRATVTVCRLFTVYGPRQRPDLAISRFVRAMRAHKPITIFGDGSFARDFTYVEDTVRGLMAALEAPAGYRVYNLGAGKPCSVLELVATIERVMGRKATVCHEAAQRGDVPLTFACVDRAAHELGFSAAVPLEDGIRRFVRWLDQAPEVYLRVGEPWSLGVS